MNLPCGVSSRSPTRSEGPQQLRVPWVRIPQVCLPPAFTAMNGPSAGSLCPPTLLPQHVTVPSVRIPQARPVPADTAVNGPPSEGRVAGGCTTSRTPSGAGTTGRSPQQVTVPSVRIPHEWLRPEETAVKVPSGTSRRFPLALFQQ